MDMLASHGAHQAGVAAAVFKEPRITEPPVAEMTAARLLHAVFTGSPLSEALAKCETVRSFAKDSSLGQRAIVELGKSPALLQQLVPALVERLKAIREAGDKREQFAAAALCRLASLPYLGVSGHFKDAFEAHDASGLPGCTTKVLSMYLELKDLHLHCGFLRLLHRRWARIPAAAWLQVVDFVGVFNPSSRLQAVANFSVGNAFVTEEMPGDDIDTEVCGNNELGVIEPIRHDEPAATISPEEASNTAEELWSSLIEHSLEVPGLTDTSVAHPCNLSLSSVIQANGSANNQSCACDDAQEHLDVDSAIFSEYPSLCILRDHNGLPDEAKESKEGMQAHLSPNSHDNADTDGGTTLPVSAEEKTAGDEGVTRYPILLLLNFTRHPEAFDKALLQGEGLREIREALARAGFSCRMPCGTKVFVSPPEYKLAMHALSGRELGPSYVVVSEAFENLVLAATHLPHKENVRVRNRQPLAMAIPGEQDVLVAKRTFLCEVRPLTDDRLTNSTTQRRRGTRNPRAKSVDCTDIAW